MSDNSSSHRHSSHTYTLIKPTGNGAFGMVYKAKDQVLNRFVAIKILRDEFTTDEEFIKRFSIEGKNLYIEDIHFLYSKIMELDYENRNKLKI